MGILAASLARPAERGVTGILPLDFQTWVDSFTFNGIGYPLGLQQTLAGHKEDTPEGFAGFVQSVYKQNGVIFACMLSRQLLFSEARFQFQPVINGRPGKLYGTQELGLLERPEPGKVTGDLLTRAIQDADLAGNFYAVRRPNRIKRLRPDWVSIVLGSMSDPSVEAGDLDAEVVAYTYWPGGKNSSREPITLLRDQVAHFAPVPDPLASYRGMSWITPVLREIMGDSAATTHKLKFFENGATPNTVVSLDPAIQKDAFDKWVTSFRKDHEGLANAYRTLYLGGGAKVEVIGANLQQVDFKVTQGAGETRIAAAAGVPPVIVGLSEGLQAATYSNYGQARRRFADLTIRPLWRNFAGSMEVIVRPPNGSRLWYDDRDIPFLREDAKDRAEIAGRESQTIRTLVDAGYDPATVIEAVISEDWTVLKHTGLFSVQLQPPTTTIEPTTPALDAGRSLAALIAPFLKEA